MVPIKILFNFENAIATVRRAITLERAIKKRSKELIQKESKQDLEQ